MKTCQICGCTWTDRMLCNRCTLTELERTDETTPEEALALTRAAARRISALESPTPIKANA